MVGLKLILQDTRMNKASAKTPQILSKTTMLKPPPPPTTTTFLQSCLLCKRHLSQGEDIYMYRGDEAFCSEECRWKQMLMDEEESMRAFLERERKLMVSYNK